MKRSLLTIISLGIFFAIFVSLFAVSLAYVLNVIKIRDDFAQGAIYDVNLLGVVDNFNVTIHKLVPWVVISAICSILSAIALIVNLVSLKSLKDKFRSYKQQRAQAKAERAEADKQAKIQALEAELEELKKD